MIVNLFKGWENVLIIVLDIFKVVLGCNNYIYFKVKYEGIVLIVVMNEIVNEIIYLEVSVLINGFFLYNVYNKIVVFENIFLVV